MNTDVMFSSKTPEWETPRTAHRSHQWFVFSGGRLMDKPNYCASCVHGCKGHAWCANYTTHEQARKLVAQITEKRFSAMLKVQKGATA